MIEPVIIDFLKNVSDVFARELVQFVFSDEKEEADNRNENKRVNQSKQVVKQVGENADSATDILTALDGFEIQSGDNSKKFKWQDKPGDAKE